MPDASEHRSDRAADDALMAQDMTWRRRDLLIVIAAVLVTFGSLFGACALVIAHFNNSFALLGEPVKPNPVPPSSCPYLRRVHDTATSAGKAWRLVGGAPPSGTQLDNPNAWPLYVPMLGTRFSDFDHTIEKAVPHVPAQIGTRLQDVHEQLQIGLAQLPKATTANDYATHTAGAVFDGYASLTNASDLTGNACGFTLAPAPSVAGWLVGIATPTT